MQLIKISQEKIGDNAINAVNARELHEFLEVNSRFNDWIKNRISKYGFIENQDFIAITKNLVTAQGNESKFIDYIISIDMAKELAMVENNEKGRQARRYFIECENKLIKQHKLPSTYAEALLEAGRLALENERLQALQIENKPKIEAFEALMSSEDLIDFLEFSKIIKIGRTTLFSKLRQLRILMSDNMPYQYYIDRGYFKCIENAFTQNNIKRIYTKTMITAKGQDYLVRKLKDN